MPYSCNGLPVSTGTKSIMHCQQKGCRFPRVKRADGTGWDCPAACFAAQAAVSAQEPPGVQRPTLSVVK